MRVYVESSGNQGSKTFIRLSFRACNSAEIGSTPLDFVHPERYARSRGCMVPNMFFQTAKDFNSDNMFIREEFDNIALFNFHLLDKFCPMRGLLPA
jgi:hypothetical protein